MIVCSLLLLSKGAVEVYPNESDKPPLGSGLNQPATVCLLRCYARDRTGARLHDSEVIGVADNDTLQTTESYNYYYYTALKRTLLTLH